MLVLMTNRKQEVAYAFLLVPKSTTLDDLEWPICTLLQKRHRVSFPDDYVTTIHNMYSVAEKMGK